MSSLTEAVSPKKKSNLGRKMHKQSFGDAIVIFVIGTRYTWGPTLPPMCLGACLLLMDVVETQLM